MNITYSKCSSTRDLRNAETWFQHLLTHFNGVLLKLGSTLITLFKFQRCRIQNKVDKRENPFPCCCTSIRWDDSSRTLPWQTVVFGCQGWQKCWLNVVPPRSLCGSPSLFRYWDLGGGSLLKLKYFTPEALKAVRCISLVRNLLIKKVSKMS